MNRFAYATFCDDIRNEVNGKMSLMGIFGSLMYLTTFPTVLPKLCVVVTASTPADRLFKSISFKGTLDGVVVFEMALDETQMATVSQSSGVIEDPKGVEAKAVVILSPLHIAAPCKMKITVIADGEEIECGGLQISPAPEDMVIV